MLTFHCALVHPLHRLHLIVLCLGLLTHTLLHHPDEGPGDTGLLSELALVGEGDILEASVTTDRRVDLGARLGGSRAWVSVPTSDHSDTIIARTGTGADHLWGW